MNTFRYSSNVALVTLKWVEPFIFNIRSMFKECNFCALPSVYNSVDFQGARVCSLDADANQLLLKFVKNSYCSHLNL